MDGAMKPITISGHAERDDLAEHLLYGDNDIHDLLVRHKAEQNADHHAKQQLERQTFNDFPHSDYYSSFYALSQGSPVTSII